MPPKQAISICGLPYPATAAAHAFGGLPNQGAMYGHATYNLQLRELKSSSDKWIDVTPLSTVDDSQMGWSGILCSKYMFPLSSSSPPKPTSQQIGLTPFHQS